MKITYLGPEGSFTEKIAKENFQKENLIPLTPIRNVILAVENKKADFGIVPLENFYNGEVRETFDSLRECSDTKIIEEKSQKIIHCIGALKNHAKIKKILSKDQALEQCSKYICEKYPLAETMAVPSTSDAVKIIKEKNILDAAAIAAEEVLKKNNFEIIAKDICPNNKTRFVLLGRKIPDSTGDDKTFLIVYPLVDKPGVLYNTLKCFSDNGINLEFIQSRPDGKRGYLFYIELNGHKDDKKVHETIEKVRKYLDPEKKYPETLKILGSYPNTHWKN